MLHKSGACRASLIAFGIVVFFSLPSAAETLTWYVQSEHPNVVSLEFYSSDRDVAWPGGGEVYLLDDWDVQTYTLECNRGEQICFGAWVRGSDNEYWGVGLDGEQGCDSCCYVCDGGETEIEVLSP